MSGSGPLAGVRVLDLSTDIGRFGAKVLAELGADVVRLGQAEAGPSLAPDVHGGLLEWWYDLNCRSLPLDLGDPKEAAAFGRLVERADILLDDTRPGYLDGLGLGVTALAERNPGLVHVSLTPYGSTGPRAIWRTSDLVAQAQGGYLSVTGDEDHPVALWGRQSAVVGGLYAGISALAGWSRARHDGTGSWIDLSLHEAIVSCTEHLLMYWWFPEALAPLGAPIAQRQRSLHWVRAFEVVPCRRGACMVSPAAGGLLGLIAWLKARGHATEVPDEPEANQLLMLIPPLMEALRAVALESDATELFEAGQSLHVPFGEAYSIEQVARCAQHLHRGFFRPVDGHTSLRVPGPLASFSAAPAPDPVAPNQPAAVAQLLDQWGPRTKTSNPAGEPGPPLRGLRVLDFTHVLAGPFATRILGDLGADVIRIQTDERSAGTGSNDFPYNVMWARNKRSIQLSMRHGGALDVLRQLVEQADIVIENFSAGVMDSWGAGPEQLASWNPSIITVSMSGCGADGPWRSYVTYAPTVHALSGLTALTGPEGESDCGPGIAYNDHISGLVAANAVLAALNHRSVSGMGQHIECSQLEVGTYLVGPALVDYFATGRIAGSAGNRDPFTHRVVNDVFRCADNDWLAVTITDVRTTEQVSAGLRLAPAPDGVAAALRLWAATQRATAAAEVLQGLGVAAGVVANADHLTTRDPQLAHRQSFVVLDSEMIGQQHVDRYPGRFHSGADPGPRGELELNYRPSPYLGQHNFDVYRDLLGWDEAQVAEAMGDNLVF